MKPKRFSPEVGQCYRNNGWGCYECTYNINSGKIAGFRNIHTGWTLSAHNVYIYDNGCIEWDYSTNGHWEI